MIHIAARASIRRIAEGTGIAAGLPADRLPIVTVNDESAAVTINTPDLTERLARTFTAWLGKDRVHAEPPITGAEDFSEYGRTVHRVPTLIWGIGAADPADYAAAAAKGQQPPSNHSPNALFVHDPTIQTCVTSMTAAVLDLAAKK